MKATHVLLSLALLSQITSAHADPKYFLYQRLQSHSLKAKMNQIAGKEQNAEAISLLASTPTGTFDQVIDHFAKISKRSAATFKQRYFVDATYATSKASPVIYYICGEGTCEGATDVPLVNSMAQKYHAYRVALEHRYYGYSQPFATLDSKNLVYLSMDQAIEDLAVFQKSLQKKMSLTGKWITVGGSYPGELSAFYRLKHPELVVGALASSGPVLAKADFFEYDRHVARVAPPACLAAIQTVVKDVEAKILQPDSAAAVKKLFNASDVKNDVDFLYVLADMAATAIQYGYQDSFCKTLTDGVAAGKATEAYAQAGNDLFSAFGLTSLQDSFQGAESVNPKDYLGFAGMRSWMYQSCTEFGFYQIANTDLKESSRSQQITQNYHNAVCKRLFGLNAAVNTVATNAKYYNQLMDASKVKNILFTNGANDPWSNLSLKAPTVNTLANFATNPNLILFTIDQAAHCDDLGSKISAGLTAARNEFDLLMKQWISE